MTGKRRAPEPTVNDVLRGFCKPSALAVLLILSGVMVALVLLIVGVQALMGWS